MWNLLGGRNTAEEKQLAKEVQEFSGSKISDYFYVVQIAEALNLPIPANKVLIYINIKRL